MSDSHSEHHFTAPSCASFDGEGRLRDWNAGFESEFSAAADLIVPGTLFRDILQRAYDQDHVIRVYLPNPNKPEEAGAHISRWPRHLESVNTFKYWDAGQFIHVQETRTVSNGVIRFASLADKPTRDEYDSIIGFRERRQSQPEAKPETAEQDRLLRAAALETSNSILLLRLRTEQKLKTLSITDALTGLANRRHFIELLESSWQKALQSRTPMGIAIVDIDYFKQYNDHYGHSGGDACLRKVATTLSESMRQGMDMVSRYGGEEFAIILPGADSNAAYAAAERARASIAELNEPHEAIKGIVTVSIGVAATIPASSMTAQNLVDQADDALYKAKGNGRNQVISAAVPGDN